MIPVRLKPVEYEALVLKDKILINEGVEGTSTYGVPGDVLLVDSEGFLRVISASEYKDRFEERTATSEQVELTAAEHSVELKADSLVAIQEATQHAAKVRANLSQTVRELLRVKPLSLDEVFTEAFKVHPDATQKSVYMALHYLKGKDPSEAYKQDVDGKWALTNAGRLAAKKAGE